VHQGVEISLVIVGDRPLVGGLDKDFGAPPRRAQTQAERNAIPELGWDMARGHNPTKQNFRRCIGEDCKTGFKYEHGGSASQQLECPHCGKIQDRHLDKQALQTTRDRAAAGLRGGQSAPAASTAASGFGDPKFGGINDKRSGNTGAAPAPVKTYKGIDPKHHAAYDKFIGEGPVTKSMDLDEPSRSWSYQG